MKLSFFSFLLLVLFSGCAASQHLAGSYLCGDGIALTSKAIKVASLAEDAKDLMERKARRKKRKEKERQEEEELAHSEEEAAL